MSRRMVISMSLLALLGLAIFSPDPFIRAMGAMGVVVAAMTLVMGEPL